MSFSIYSNPQRAWMEKLRRMNPTDFKFRMCLGTPEGKPGIWVEWSNWDWERNPTAQYRTLLPNELCLDMDIDNPDTLFWTAYILKKRLESEGVPFLIYDSGGKGYHFQIWLECDEPDVDWRALRCAVVRKLCEGIQERVQDKKGQWHWNIDPKKYNWDDSSSGSVVREIGGRKRYAKVLVDDIDPPETRKRKTRPVYPDVEFITWKVPKDMVKPRQKFEKVEIKFDIEIEVPVCIESLVEEEMSGVHLNHAQRLAIVAHYWKSAKSKGEKVDVQQLQQIFVNDPVYDPNVTFYQINNVINSLEQEPRKVPGCKYMRDNGLIDSDFCWICPDKILAKKPKTNQK